MTEANEIERERSERRRHAWRTGAMALIGLGAAAMALGGVTALDASDRERAIGLGVALGGAVLFVAGAVVGWRWRHRPEAWRSEGGYRDRVQRQRRSQMLMMPILMLLAVGFGVPAVISVLAGDGDFADWFWAVAIMLHALIAPMMLMGWDGEARKQKRLLDDEFTRQLRGRAMALAFVVLTVGVVVVFGIGLWRPDLAVTLMPIALFVAGAAGCWRFAWLDREAEHLG